MQYKMILIMMRKRYYDISKALYLTIQKTVVIILCLLFSSTPKGQDLVICGICVYVAFYPDP